MDYHRFTFTEVDRILNTFSKHKIFLPDGNGYGGVFWLVLTFFSDLKGTQTYGASYLNVLTPCLRSP